MYQTQRARLLVDPPEGNCADFQPLSDNELVHKSRKLFTIPQINNAQEQTCKPTTETIDVFAASNYKLSTHIPSSMHFVFFNFQLIHSSSPILMLSVALSLLPYNFHSTIRNRFASIIMNECKHLILEAREWREFGELGKLLISPPPEQTARRRREENRKWIRD